MYIYKNKRKTNNNNNKTLSDTLDTLHYIFQSLTQTYNTVSSV